MGGTQETPAHVSRLTATRTLGTCRGQGGGQSVAQVEVRTWGPLSPWLAKPASADQALARAAGVHHGDRVSVVAGRFVEAHLGR